MSSCWYTINSMHFSSLFLLSVWIAFWNLQVVHGDGVLDSAEVRNHLENILLSLSFQDSIGYYCMTPMQRSGNLKLVSSSSLTGFGLHGFGRWLGFGLVIVKLELCKDKPLYCLISSWGIFSGFILREVWLFLSMGKVFFCIIFQWGFCDRFFLNDGWLFCSEGVQHTEWRFDSASACERFEAQFCGLFGILP